MILPVLFLALGLRLININQSLWWDEAINVLAVRDNGLFELVTKYAFADFHPPGFFVFLWFWTKLFGYSEIAVRIPSVLFSLLTIYFTYLIGTKLFSKTVGLLAAIFLSLAPLHIYYSQEARMYSFAAMATSASIYFLIRLVNKEKFGLMGYSLSIALLLYSDYVAYFALIPQITFILFFQQKLIKRFFFSLILSFLLFLPWLFILPSQFINGQQTANLLSGWKQVVGEASIKSIALLFIKTLIGRISFDNKAIYTIFVGAVSIPFGIIILNSLRNFNTKGRLLWLWLIVPVAVSFFVSFYIPIFAYFRFIFILPAFYLLIASGVEKFSIRKSMVLIILVVISELVSSSIYLLNPNFHREDWKSAVSQVEHTLNQSTLVLYETPEVPAPVRYYSADFSKSSPGLNLNIEEKLKGKDKVFLFEYLVDVYDPQRTVEDKLENLGFTREKTTDFRGVGFIHLYSKI